MTLLLLLYHRPLVDRRPVRIVYVPIRSRFSHLPLPVLTGNPVGPSRSWRTLFRLLMLPIVQGLIIEGLASWLR